MDSATLDSETLLTLIQDNIKKRFAESSGVKDSTLIGDAFELLEYLDDKKDFKAVIIDVDPKVKWMNFATELALQVNDSLKLEEVAELLLAGNDLKLKESTDDKDLKELKEWLVKATDLIPFCSKRFLDRLGNMKTFMEKKKTQLEEDLLNAKERFRRQENNALVSMANKLLEEAETKDKDVVIRECNEWSTAVDAYEK